MRAKYVAAALLLTFVAVSLVIVARDSARETEVAAQTPQAAPPVAAAPVEAAIVHPVTAPTETVVENAPPVTPSKVVVPVEAVKKVVAPPPAAARVDAPVSAPVAPVRKVVATYFHGDVRCATCRKVEAYAKEAVESGFADAVRRGELEFRAVNVDRPENRHFIEDFQLTNKSVVVTEEVDGRIERHVKLDDVWRLVGDHDAYLLYVQDAVRVYLEHV